jgi:hypothetical protein
LTLDQLEEDFKNFFEMTEQIGSKLIDTFLMEADQGPMLYKPFSQEWSTPFLIIIYKRGQHLNN